MPNGVDKNWFRMCSAINGFRARYGSWPTIIRLPEGSIEYLFTEESYAKLQEQLTFIYDDSKFIVEDEMGRSYNYAQEGFSEKQPDIRANEWLKVTPDSEMVKDYYTPRGSSLPAQAEKKVNRRKIGFWGVVASELVLLYIVIIILLGSAAINYNGTCVSWEPPIPDCSMSEYLRQVWRLMPLSLTFLSIQYWWIALPLVILFPVLGNSILTSADRRSKKIANTPHK